jgi:two-component sensor histidine kinase
MAILFVSFKASAQRFSEQDTTTVRRLLDLASSYGERIGKDTALLDSALHFSNKAVFLSQKISYDSGIVNGYLTEYQIWVHLLESKISLEQNVDRELAMLDSLEDRINQKVTSGKDYGRAGEIFAKLANSHDDYTRATYDRKIAVFDKAISFFDKAQDYQNEVNCWYRSGYTHHVHSQLEKAESAYLKSLEVAKAGDVKEVQQVYAILGNIYAFRGNYKLALKYELDALRKSQENQDSLILGSIHLYLGLIYEPLQDHLSALKHYRLAMNEFEKHPEENMSDLSHATGNTAKMLIKNKEPNVAIALIEETLRKYPEMRSMRGYSGLVMRQMQAYYELEEIGKAQAYCDELILLNNKKPIQSNLSAILRFLVDTKQYHKAEPLLSVFHEMVASRKIKKLEAEAFHFKFQIDSARGNFRSALTNYLAYDTISTALLDEIKAREIAELQIQYDTEQKEKNIELLQKQSLIDKNNVEKAEILRNGAWVGLLFLSIILGLIYHQNKSRKKANKHLARLVKDKELLLKEVHHRVKNNLQIVLSLLESQSRSLRDDAYLAVSETQNRVYTMSLIHKKLYQSEDIAAINIRDYLTELTLHLGESFGNQSTKIRCSIDPIIMDISQAVPLGLIINEAVTNALKHAFQSDREGNEIEVVLRRLDGFKTMLKIEDNGNGLEQKEKRSNEGLGMKLIRGLTEDLEGMLTITQENGMRIAITFEASEPLPKISDQGINMTA